MNSSVSTWRSDLRYFVPLRAVNAGANSRITTASLRECVEQMGSPYLNRTYQAAISSSRRRGRIRHAWPSRSGGSGAAVRTAHTHGCFDWNPTRSRAGRGASPMARSARLCASRHLSHWLRHCRTVVVRRGAGTGSGTSNTCRQPHLLVDPHRCRFPQRPGTDRPNPAIPAHHRPDAQHAGTSAPIGHRAFRGLTSAGCSGVRAGTLFRGGSSVKLRLGSLQWQHGVHSGPCKVAGQVPLRTPPDLTCALTSSWPRQSCDEPQPKELDNLLVRPSVWPGRRRPLRSRETIHPKGTCGSQWITAVSH